MTNTLIKHNAFFFLGFSFLILFSNSSQADCPKFGGSYILTSPQANFVTRLNVTQKSCNEIEAQTLYDEGGTDDRTILVDGQPHVTLESDHETVTETFKWVGGKIMYTSNVNYVWGEKFINYGIISQGPKGEWIDEYTQWRYDGIYLYTTKLVYSR